MPPTIAPDEFENIKGSKAKRHKVTGEIWELDLLHRNHWEVYKDLKNWERVNVTAPFGMMGGLRRNLYEASINNFTYS
jgi:hypothetical protein